MCEGREEGEDSDIVRVWRGGRRGGYCEGVRGGGGGDNMREE